MAPSSLVKAPSSSRTLKLLAVVALLVVAVYGMRELAWLIAPIAGTTLVVTLLYPVYPALRARRVPHPVAVAALVLAAYLSLAVLLALVGYAITRFATTVTEFTDEMATVVWRVEEWFAAVGLAAPDIDQILDWVEIPAVAGWVVGQIPGIVAVVAMLVLVGTAMMFQGVEASQITRRTRLLRQRQPALVEALELCARRTRKFFGMTTIFAVIVGVLDTVLLLAMGIPLAALWGLLAAVCNYVPFLGFWVGLVPPALLALAIHGWGGMLLVIAVYLVLNFVITSLVPTKFVSDAVGLSMVVEVVSIVFWAWALGPLGAILAIPLTLFAKAILVDANPRAAWLNELISSGKSLAATDRAAVG